VRTKRVPQNVNPTMFQIRQTRSVVGMVANDFLVVLTAVIRNRQISSATMPFIDK